MTSVKFILSKIFTILKLDHYSKYIKISKSNKTLKFYNNWWGEIYELIKNDLYKIVKHNIYSEMNFLL